MVSSCDIKKNEVLKKEMLTAKRPGTGIPPSDIDKLVGRIVKKNIVKDTILKKNFLNKNDS